MKKIIVYGLALLFMLVPGLVLSSSVIARPAEDYTWVGPTGDPLPFESFQDAEEFLAASEVARSKTHRDGINKYKKVVLDKDGVWANSIFRWENVVKRPDFNSTSLSGQNRHFRDSYESELAAYKINEILGLYNIPPTVYREVEGRSGSVQLWMEKTTKEVDRRNKGTTPPDVTSWNRQSHDMRVFDNLINNIDRNQNNILIDKGWNLWLIDHTRSFAMDESLPSPEKVSRCSRSLYNALKQMDEGLVRESLSSLLSEAEVDAFFVRRELLIKLLEDRIAEAGESNVFYD
ncbi:MAG: hypothetical protein JW896_08895 [Deltaproteobacteria bacterium]|nr:hypothetical protein [Deltaproteobacteria bacterium]